jgi:putative solute:sodium symporter small subunit
LSEAKGMGVTMKKIDSQRAEAYFKARTKIIVICLFFWAIASFGVVTFAESLGHFTVNGMPFHYFMGAQGSILLFIALLFINAVLSDRIDRRFGVDEKANERLGSGQTMDH